MRTLRENHQIRIIVYFKENNTQTTRIIIASPLLLPLLLRYNETDDDQRFSFLDC